MTSTSQFAVNIERSEQQLLREIAESSDNRGVKGVLNRIANDEEQVIQKLSELCATGEESACFATNDLETVNRFPLGKIDPKEVAKELHDSQDAYRFVMKVEKDLELVYRSASAGIKNSNIKNALDSVLDIKHDEMRDVENMYYNANAPNENLEWGEFSNTDEFHQFGRDLY